jgi:hypothetical protein
LLLKPDHACDTGERHGVVYQQDFTDASESEETQKSKQTGEDLKYTLDKAETGFQRDYFMGPSVM